MHSYPYRRTRAHVVATRLALALTLSILGVPFAAPTPAHADIVTEGSRRRTRLVWVVWNSGPTGNGKPLEGSRPDEYKEDKAAVEVKHEDGC